LGTPTLLAGLSIHLSHAWLRFSLSGLGTEVPTALGGMALGLWRLGAYVRPLHWMQNNMSVRGEVGVAGGVGFASGRPSMEGELRGETVLASLSARAVVSMCLKVATDVLLEVALGLDFDFLGAELRSGSETVATTYGPSIGLRIGAALPL